VTEWHRHVAVVLAWRTKKQQVGVFELAAVQGSDILEHQFRAWRYRPVVGKVLDIEADCAATESQPASGPRHRAGEKLNTERRAVF
jgi:hypothetical protein